MDAGVLVQAGNASLTGNRIGDYAGMSIDPSSGNTFWAANEYGLSAATGNWGTAIAQFQMTNSVNQTLTSITVLPSMVSLAYGGTQQFTGIGLDQHGDPMTTQPTFTWSLTGGGKIDANTGLYTAPSSGSGTAIVSASVNGSGVVPGTATAAYGTPAAPSNLAATAVSATQVKLTWYDNALNEAGFIIQRSTNSGKVWSQIATVGANVTTYLDNTVRKSQTYWYRVAAYNAYGNSTWSNVATVTTPFRGPGGTDDEQPVVWVHPTGLSRDRDSDSSDSSRDIALAYAADLALLELGI
jgi:hypothetical protein